MPTTAPAASATTTASMMTATNMTASASANIVASVGGLINASVAFVDGVAAYIDAFVDVDIIMTTSTTTAVIRWPPITPSVVPIIVVVAQGNTQGCGTHCCARHAGRRAVVNLFLTRGGVVGLTSCRQSQCEHGGHKTLK